MCGLAGMIAPDASAALVQRMIVPLAHRGPDDQGIWADEAAGVALAHRRLAILDLSAAGAQPMASPSGRYQLVYNGEVYNHLALRTSLGAVAWRGHSDTETLLALADAHGAAALPGMLVGMFAIALWDRETRQLHLMRDRFGEKPLYYGWLDGRFAFASELKALVSLGDARPEIDRQALADFVRLSYVPAPRSIYRDIYKLQPGCHLVLDTTRPHPAPALPPTAPIEGAVAITRYWSLAEVARAGETDPICDPARALSLLETQLIESVAAQTLSDVPLGAFLSGGVDSSLIVALLKAGGAASIRTFTIGFDDPAYDESPHARAVAAHLGTEHTELTVSAEDARAVIPMLPAIYDEPFADASQIATFLVAQLARRDVTVALSGDAGDELFGGYNRHITARGMIARLRSLPAPARAVGARLLAALPPATWSTLARLPIGRRFSLLGSKIDKLVALLGAGSDPAAVYASLIATWRGVSPVRGATPSPASLAEGPADIEHRMMLQDGLDYLPDDVLVKVDRASMAVSLETRAPFLDHRVAELAWRLPIAHKIAGGRGKLPLRAILDRHVPRALIDRPKAGFEPPIGEWLRGPLRNWAEELLPPERMRAEGWLDADAVSRRWREHVAGRAQHTTELWNILMFQQWLGSR